MKERSFDEMISYFNCRVADMDISQDYKMELLGMVTALGYKHEKTAQQWITCSNCARNADNGGLYPDGRTRCPIQEHYALLKDGYCHLAEPWKGERS